MVFENTGTKYIRCGSQKKKIRLCVVSIRATLQKDVSAKQEREFQPSLFQHLRKSLKMAERFPMGYCMRPEHPL
jgi:hypothetical protein